MVEDARGSLVLVVNVDMDERSELSSSMCDLSVDVPDQCRSQPPQASTRPGASPCLPHAISVPARHPCSGPRPHALVQLHHGHRRISRAAVSSARLRRVLPGTISHGYPQRRASAEAGEQRVEADAGERKVEGGAQSDDCATRGCRTATPGNCAPAGAADTAASLLCRQHRDPPRSIQGQLLISVYYRPFIFDTLHVHSVLLSLLPLS